MKMIIKPLFSGVTLLVVLSLISNSKGQLIMWEDFLRNVGRKFVSLLEVREITGNGMPMKDFEGTLNQTMYDIDANGVAKYHSGFVAKIDECSITPTSLRAQLADSFVNVNDSEFVNAFQITSNLIKSYVHCFLTLDGVQTVYDVDYDYDNFKGRGTVLTWFKQLQFQMEVRRNHTTNEITSDIFLTNSGNQNEYVVKVYPSNGYTQLTAREIKRSLAYRQPMHDSFREWSESWRNELRIAVAAYKFPEICYYCQ